MGRWRGVGKIGKKKIRGIPQTILHPSFRPANKGLIEVHDADSNDTTGTDEEILPCGSTQSGRVPKSHPNGRTEKRGMMVVERQEVSAIAATPLVRFKPLTLRMH